MTIIRVKLLFLTRLGHGRGSSFPASKALIDSLDAATAASDGCSTSCISDSWGGHRAIACFATQASRASNRYNFIQPVDTKYVTALLDQATLVEHAAIPVLRYGAWFDPEQVTRTLQRLPRMLRYQRRNGPKASADSASATSLRLLDALGSRLAQVAPDCTDEQLTRGLWAFGVSRRHHPDVIRVACEQLSLRLPSLTTSHLATTAWSLAAATSTAPDPAREPVRQALQAIAQHLVATRPANIAVPVTSSTPPAKPSLSSSLPRGQLKDEAAAATATGPAADAVAAAVAADRAVLAADRPWLNHRSAVKLAWAFASLDIRHTQALDIIGDAAAARISSQLQAHDWSSGPLLPRATFLYWTIRGWQAWPRPRPPRARTGGRPSRYLRDERPRRVLRDFTLASLAPLLAAFRRLGHRHEGLLQASAQHVVASAGPSLRVAPTDLTRVVGALEALDFRHPPALAALLSSCRLSTLPVPLLTRLAGLAAGWGVTAKSSKRLYGRLVQQLVARAWINDGKTVAVPEQAEPFPAPISVTTRILRGDGGGVGLGEEEAEAPPQLDPCAKESSDARLPSLSWRTDAGMLQREAEQWAQVHRRPEDGVTSGELCKVLRALAKVRFQESDPDAPLLASIFTLVVPYITALDGDALADLALAAVQYGPLLDRQQGANLPVPPTHLDLLRDVTHAVLYSSRAAAGTKPAGLQQRLLSLTGMSSSTAAARTASTAAEAAEIRQVVGLSAAGALRLAAALTLRPSAVAEGDLRAVLSLVDLDSTSRKQLGVLVQRMRQGGRNGVLPPRLLEAVGEAPL